MSVVEAGVVEARARGTEVLLALGGSTAGVSILAGLTAMLLRF